jgi:hypothetical protein
VVTFFFSSTRNQSYGLNDLLRHLLAQLSPLDSIPDALYEIYKANTKTFPPTPPDDNEELIEALGKILTGSSLSGASPAPQTYIFLDGLDEIAPLSQTRQVTDFLNTLVKLGLQNLHLLVTSRALAMNGPWHPMWVQYAIPSPEVACDIGLYVSRAVSGKLGHLSRESQQRIIARLSGPGQTM